MLITHGARAVLRAAAVATQAGKHLDGLRGGALKVQQRTHHNKATWALANQLARICYATLRDGVVSTRGSMRRRRAPPSHY
ncbi:MAG: hypothetical protein ACT4NU_10005, partial [Chromatiales bacterium]